MLECASRILFRRMPGSIPKREGKRKGGKIIAGEEKGRKQERKGKKRKKGKYKEKGFKWLLPHYYFSFLPKLLGRFLETAEPVP